MERDYIAITKGTVELLLLSTPFPTFSEININFNTENVPHESANFSLWRGNKANFFLGCVVLSSAFTSFKQFSRERWISNDLNRETRSTGVLLYSRGRFQKILNLKIQKFLNNFCQCARSEKKKKVFPEILLHVTLSALHFKALISPFCKASSSMSLFHRHVECRQIYLCLLSHLENFSVHF